MSTDVGVQVPSRAHTPASSPTARLAHAKTRTRSDHIYPELRIPALRPPIPAVGPLSRCLLAEAIPGDRAGHPTAAGIARTRSQTAGHEPLGPSPVTPISCPNRARRGSRPRTIPGRRTAYRDSGSNRRVPTPLPAQPTERPSAPVAAPVLSSTFAAVQWPLARTGGWTAIRGPFLRYESDTCSATFVHSGVVGVAGNTPTRNTDWAEQLRPAGKQGGTTHDGNLRFGAGGHSAGR